MITNSPNTLLDELHNYHLPSAISWWSLAIGWWLVLFLILVLIGAIISIWLYRRKKFAAIRYAQTELIAIKISFNKDKNIAKFIRSVSKLLRRFALVHFPRDQIAKLTGAAWLKFLDDHGGQGQFQKEFNWLFIEIPYQKEDTLNLISNKIECADKLANLVTNWLQYHQKLPNYQKLPKK